MTFPLQFSAEGAVLTTISQCECRSLAYLWGCPLGPCFLLFTVLNTPTSLGYACPSPLFSVCLCSFFLLVPVAVKVRSIRLQVGMKVCTFDQKRAASVVYPSLAWQCEPCVGPQSQGGIDATPRSVHTTERWTRHTVRMVSSANCSNAHMGTEPSLSLHGPALRPCAGLKRPSGIVLTLAWYAAGPRRAPCRRRVNSIPGVRSPSLCGFASQMTVVIKRQKAKLAGCEAHAAGARTRIAKRDLGLCVLGLLHSALGFAASGLNSGHPVPQRSDNGRDHPKALRSYLGTHPRT